MAPAGDTTEPITEGRLEAGPADPIDAAAIASRGQTEAATLASARLAIFHFADEPPSDDVAAVAGYAEGGAVGALNDRGPWCCKSFGRVARERPAYRYRTPGQIACCDKTDPCGRNPTRVR